MMMRNTHSFLAVAGLMAVAVGCQGPANVTLTLADVQATVETRDDIGGPERQVLNVQCTVTAENNTGQALSVETNFYSPFDGLSLVAMDRSGRELFRMGYTFHQSPYAPAQQQLLAPGETTQVLHFPIIPWDGDESDIAFKLVGGFAGTAYAHDLESNTVVVLVRNAASSP